MDPILLATSHRQWAVPTTPWIMKQTWRDLMFMHWPVVAAELRPLLPPGLPLDLFAGEAWVAVVPFHITGLRARGLPPLPYVSYFPEINVRTYVTLGGKPGVYFFSLDVNRVAAVMAARYFYRVPYFSSRMTLQMTPAPAEGGAPQIRYRSSRRQPPRPAGFSATYAPASPHIELAAPASLEYFLTERYCLYTADRRGNLYRGDIQHPPWRLQNGEADIALNTMAAAHGITLPAEKPLLHFSRTQPVLFWPLQRIR